MLRAGVFKNERTAEEQVVQVLNFDIHLLKDFRGRRYIERITECIPIEERNEYTFDHRNEKTMEGKFEKFADNATIFFTKTTNRELYKHRNVLEFDGDKYVLTNPISETNIIERNWGIKPPKREDEIEAEEKAKAEENAKAEAQAKTQAQATQTAGNVAQKRPTRKPMTSNGEDK